MACQTWLSWKDVRSIPWIDVMGFQGIAWCLKGEVHAEPLIALDVDDSTTCEQLKRKIVQDLKAKKCIDRDFGIEDLTMEFGDVDDYAKHLKGYKFDADFDNVGSMRSLCGDNIRVIVNMNFDTQNYHIGWCLKGEHRGMIDAEPLIPLNVGDLTTCEQLRWMIFQVLKEKRGIDQEFGIEDVNMEFGALDDYAKHLKSYILDANLDNVSSMRSLCGDNIRIIVSINIDIGLILLQTSRQLATTNFSLLPKRQSHRVANNITRSIPAKTYNGFIEWEGWREGLNDLENDLDDRDCCFQLPTDALQSSFRMEERLIPTEESEVKAYVLMIFFSNVNALATKYGLEMRWADGGSGRTLSGGNTTLLDKTVVEDYDNMSSRVFGNGEVKGPWQFLLEPHATIFDIFEKSDYKNICNTESLIQQCFGNMIFDETAIGFVSNFNETVFFKRSLDVNSKTLEVSPIIRANKDKPLLAYLFALKMAAKTKLEGVKQKLLRSLVPVPLVAQHRLELPITKMSVSSEKPLAMNAEIVTQSGHAGNERDTNKLGLTMYSFDDLNLSASCISGGQFGNLLEGSHLGRPTVIKLYASRYSSAEATFVREVMAYNKLAMLQGTVVPVLFRYGRLFHTDDMFLELDKSSGEPLDMLHKDYIAIASDNIISAIKSIHGYRIVHNDISADNILLSDSGQVSVLDFGKSYVGKSTDFAEEMKQVERLLTILVEDHNKQG